MEYVILIIVIAVLAVATGGWLLFVRPGRGRHVSGAGRAPEVPPAPAAPGGGPGGGTAEETATAPETPAAATAVLDLERPPPSAGRLVRLLTSRGQDVEVTGRAKPRNRAYGRIRVLGEARA